MDAFKDVGGTVQGSFINSDSSEKTEQQRAQRILGAERHRQ